MNLDRYRDEIHALRAQLASARKDAPKTQIVQRGIISASLYNLMPSIPVENHDAVIDNITFFQKWAIRDQHHLELLDHLVHDGPRPDFAALQRTPTIFCSYHLGSYRLLAPYLVRQGLSLTLLIDANVASLQIDDFHAVIAAADPTAIPTGRFEILDTAKGNLLIAMRRALRQGRSLLVFIDGNSSVKGNEAEPDNMEAITFLGHSMYARKGVAYLAHLTGATITPLLLYRTGEDALENKLCFYPPITPGTEPRENFVRATMTQLYAILERALLTSYEQWESWRYIDKSLALKNVELVAAQEHGAADETLLYLNTERYALYDLDPTESLIFDRRTYRSLIVSKTFHQFLENFRTPQPAAASLEHPKMTPGALRGLLSKEILVVANHRAIPAYA